MIRVALVVGLIAAVLGSALGVVYSQHRSRLLFAQVQGLQHQVDELEIEWGRLELEQSAWSAHGRLEKLAHERLNMRIPAIDEVRVVVR